MEEQIIEKTETVTKQKEEKEKETKTFSQEEVNAIVSKQTKKVKEALEKANIQLESISKEEKDSKEKMDNKTKILEEELEAIKLKMAENSKEKEVNEFRKKAKNLNVDENLVNTLISSGSDLTKVNLEQFVPEKKAEIKSLGKSIPKEDEEKEERITAVFKKAFKK